MDQKTFLESIRMEPDDRLLRLAYADWLDEDGQLEEASRQRLLGMGKLIPRKNEKTGWFFIRCGVIELGGYDVVFKDLEEAEKWSLIWSAIGYL